MSPVCGIFFIIKRWNLFSLLPLIKTYFRYVLDIAQKAGLLLRCLDTQLTSCIHLLLFSLHMRFNPAPLVLVPPPLVLSKAAAVVEFFALFSLASLSCSKSKNASLTTISPLAITLSPAALSVGCCCQDPLSLPLCRRSFLTRGGFSCVTADCFSVRNTSRTGYTIRIAMVPARSGCP